MASSNPPPLESCGKWVWLQTRSPYIGVTGQALVKGLVLPKFQNLADRWRPFDNFVDLSFSVDIFSVAMCWLYIKES